MAVRRHGRACTAGCGQRDRHAHQDEDAGWVPRSDVHVRLADGSPWQGPSSRVQTMAIKSGSQWTPTGDATAGELLVLNSALALSHGSVASTRSPWTVTCTLKGRRSFSRARCAVTTVP